MKLLNARSVAGARVFWKLSYGLGAVEAQQKAGSLI